MSVAITDLGVGLYKYDTATSKYKYLVAVTAAPATGGAGSQIEVTELDSIYKQYVSDREETPAFEFDFNYTIANMTAVEAAFDGHSENKYLMLFSDKSGYEFTGIGTAWTDSISRGAAIVGKISVAVSHKEWNAAVTSTDVDTTTIPVGKYDPFVEGPHPAPAG